MLVNEIGLNVSSLARSRMAVAERSTSMVCTFDKSSLAAVSVSKSDSSSVPSTSELDTVKVVSVGRLDCH